MNRIFNIFWNNFYKKSKSLAHYINAFTVSLDQLNVSLLKQSMILQINKLLTPIIWNVVL